MGDEKKILLVDDESGIRKILRIFLELEGFTVFEASNAAETYKIMEKESPAAVILDVILFGTTGFEICEKIKSGKKGKEVTVIMFTALNQEHDIEEGKRVKADVYLTKPLNPKEVVETVKKVLESK
ncbi:MAG: response regulator transcription factor [Fibrobacterota bacterium]